MFHQKKQNNQVVNNAIEYGFHNIKPMARVSFAKVIPKKLHFIWIGGRLSENNFANIKSFAAANPDYELNIWTDKPQNIIIAETLSDSGTFKYNLRNIYQLQKIMPVNISSYLLREIHGTYKNLPAASDILRIFALSEGGIYFDVDVRTGGIHYYTEYKHLKAIPLGDLYAPYGFLLNFWYNPNTKTYKIPTHIMAAVKDSIYVDKFKELLLKKIIQINPEILWSIKRKFPSENESKLVSERFQQTLNITGPTFIQKNYKNILLSIVQDSSSDILNELVSKATGLRWDQNQISYKEVDLFPILAFPTDSIINIGLMPRASGSWATFFDKRKLRSSEFEDSQHQTQWEDYQVNAG